MLFLAIMADPTAILCRLGASFSVTSNSEYQRPEGYDLYWIFATSLSDKYTDAGTTSEISKRSENSKHLHHKNPETLNYG